jgi:hypothetical protein
MGQIGAISSPHFVFVFILVLLFSSPPRGIGIYGRQGIATPGRFRFVNLHRVRRYDDNDPLPLIFLSDNRLSSGCEI